VIHQFTARPALHCAVWFSVRRQLYHGAVRKKIGEAEDLAVSDSRGRLIAGCWDYRLHVDPLAVHVEVHFSLHQGGQGPVPARPDISAGDELGAALPDEDAAGGDELAAKSFYAEPFADAVASVADTAAAFLVSHKI